MPCETVQSSVQKVGGDCFSKEMPVPRRLLFHPNLISELSFNHESAKKIPLQIEDIRFIWRQQVPTSTIPERGRPDLRGRQVRACAPRHQTQQRGPRQPPTSAQSHRQTQVRTESGRWRKDGLTISCFSSLVAIPEQRTPAPSRSYSMCCDTKPIIRQNEVNTNMAAIQTY